MKHPAVESGFHSRTCFNWAERIISCFFPFPLPEMLVWENVHRSLFMGSPKEVLNVSIGKDKQVSRSLAEQQDFTNQALRTLGSTVHLTCWSWRRRLRFNYSFFLFLTSSHHSLSLWGAGRSEWSLYSGSGLATRSSGLQKNPYSLWHMLRRSIIPLSVILSRALSSPLSPVRSVFTGACKITWQEPLKALDRTNVPSALQTFTNFLVSLEWGVDWKEVHVVLPKGQWSLNMLQS